MTLVLSWDIPGQKSLSWDFCTCPCPRTKGQRDRQNFFVPGQRDSGTEVPLLSWDKGTTEQAQNLDKGQDGPGQPVKIRDRLWNGTVQDFDSLSHPEGQNGTEQKRTKGQETIFFSMTKGHREVQSRFVY